MVVRTEVAAHAVSFLVIVPASKFRSPFVLLLGSGRRGDHDALDGCRGNGNTDNNRRIGSSGSDSQ